MKQSLVRDLFCYAVSAFSVYCVLQPAIPFLLVVALPLFCKNLCCCTQDLSRFIVLLQQEAGRERSSLFERDAFLSASNHDMAFRKLSGCSSGAFCCATNFSPTRLRNCSHLFILVFQAPTKQERRKKHYTVPRTLPSLTTKINAYTNYSNCPFCAYATLLSVIVGWYR